MQKFHKGDWVLVAKDLGPHMRHFTSNVEAIVIGSYADQYGGCNTDSFTLHLKGRGRCSWYRGHQLTLIEPSRLDKLQEWEGAAETERQRKSDLDWIFANGAEVLDTPHGASVQALANCFGLTNLWGARGEGVTYCANALRTLQSAAPYLVTGDKAGWLAACAACAPQPADAPTLPPQP